MQKTIAFIPARGGSKGLPNKNILPFCGKPLIAWSIQQALSSEFIEAVYVSTDSPEIAEISEAYGAVVPFLRPADISGDTATTEAAMLHFSREMESAKTSFDVMVLLQATSPIRKAKVLDTAIRQFFNEKNDSLLSVSDNHRFFWKTPSKPEALYDFSRRPRRQDISDCDRWYMETGSFYITKRTLLDKCKNRLGGSIGMYVTSESESYEIDSNLDFKVCETLMSELLNEGEV